jgi:hypothetical protein
MTQHFTTPEFAQFLKDNGIEPTTENLITCVLDRHESIIVRRTKQSWVIKKGDCYATEYTQDEALLSLMSQLIIEGEMTTEDFLYNYNLNK